MTMTAEEIVRHYNQAANKKADITVLADLNLTDTASIRAILVDAGVLEPDKKRQRNLSKNATEGAPSAENPPKRRRAKGALRPGDGLSEPSPGRKVPSAQETASPSRLLIPPCMTGSIRSLLQSLRLRQSTPGRVPVSCVCLCFPNGLQSVWA